MLLEMEQITMAMPSFEKIDSKLFTDETELVLSLAELAKLDDVANAEVKKRATEHVLAVRKNRRAQGSIDAFMQEYSLSSEEGVVLMCLAEALLRIPDAQTADMLIADKIGSKNWEAHLGQSESMFVNASAWGLLLTGKIIELDKTVSSDGLGFLKRMVGKSGEPLIRNGMKQAMRMMGRQFVLGQTIEEATTRAQSQENAGYRYSYDMLGESAMTMKDAGAYLHSYKVALEEIGRKAPYKNVFENPSLSVKLSALHPRYESKNSAACLDHLFGSVLGLAKTAKALNVGLTIDAEEVHRLELSLQLFARLAQDENLKNWDGLGLAVQAYGRRAYPVLEWLTELALLTGRKLPVRLVKGAYWDTEIKRAQEAGLESYPVFTRKVSTDVSYLACAKYLLSKRNIFFPQFATHNAQTLAAVSVMAGAEKGFEFQRLHGMGQALYDEVIAQHPCRTYAPVGHHTDLLAYLVRRLLENGANTSFVNRLADSEVPIESIVIDPVEEVQKLTSIPHPRIPMPQDIFAPRKNSAGIPLWRESARMSLQNEMEKYAENSVSVRPLVNGIERELSDETINDAMNSAALAQEKWDKFSGAARAEILEKAADLYEQNRTKFCACLVKEAGKTLDNALGDIREAVDFLRFYAAQTRIEFSTTTALPGPTGERNEISRHGRGIFACISPWNFPLAIFTGQIAAALAAGNSVIAKPAEQTPIIGLQAVQVLHQAGVPHNVLQFLPGDGAAIGHVMLQHEKLAGVAFTGSNETAKIINRSLAARDGAFPVFIAETGGMNAMIVDSSALLEQAVRDVVASAFDSAGQRCSAARILFVQSDVADRMIDMLRGAMAELKIGDPANYSTDIGPVIDAEAKAQLEQHKAQMRLHAKVICELPMPEAEQQAHFVTPAAYELHSIDILNKEVFGPILHVVRFEASKLDEVCDAINAKGYGLTLGLHTRIDSTVARVRARMKVGNLYVNRNQIGAVVGAQPFGGEGLSGTGPKAGGADYLRRFAVERVVSADTTASGGNASLLSLV
jgi:RHH-type proline utilization regulon transcriptional repressor/proline dehydrogenase/delta 1-pyrroline-5-carboxylate dehydrogenase